MLLQGLLFFSESFFYDSYFVQWVSQFVVQVYLVGKVGRSSGFFNFFDYVLQYMFGLLGIGGVVKVCVQVQQGVAYCGVVGWDDIIFGFSCLCDECWVEVGGVVQYWVVFSGEVFKGILGKGFCVFQLFFFKGNCVQV